MRVREPNSFAPASSAGTGEGVFRRFEQEARFLPNWIGVLHDRAFFADELAAEPDFPRVARPAHDQTALEWIDVLEAVMAARKRFTVVELGAGIGTWSVNSIAALRAYSDLPYRVLAVEADPMHFRWMRDHFRLNHLRRRWCRRVHAAVWNTDGTADFYSGEADRWYGQTLVTIAGPGLDHSVVRVKTVTLARLLRRVDRVDLLHLDVQGAELPVLEQGQSVLSRVKRVHIATHSAHGEEGLRVLFSDAGWQCLNDYTLGTTAETPAGEVTFRDGIQTWLNPNMPE